MGPFARGHSSSALPEKQREPCFDARWRAPQCSRAENGEEVAVVGPSGLRCNAARNGEVAAASSNVALRK